MNTIPSTQVIVVKGEHINQLTSQTAIEIESFLEKNGYTNVFTEKDGLIKIFERPGNKWNKKSTILTINVQGYCINSSCLDEL